MAPTQKRSVFVDPDSHEVVHTGGRPKWVVPAYYATCGWFILSGVIALVTTMTAKKVDLEFMRTVAIIFSSVRILLGLGLIAKIEFVRGIVNFVCGISLIFGILGLLSSFGSIMIFGLLGVLVLIQNVIDIATNAAMIYLIGETD